MYSRSLSRAARNASINPGNACTSHRITPTALSASPSTRSHQRRRSSSKTSCPPGGSRSSEQPTSNTSSSPGEGDKSAATEGEKRQSPRLSRRKSKEESSDSVKTKDDAFANVPAVPSTNHLHFADVAVSSFFSLHRPISIRQAIPPQSSTQSFNAIFDPPKSSSSHKPNDVIYTLTTAVSTLEKGGRSSEETDLRREVLANSSSNAEPEMVTHVNGPPVHNLEDLAKAFRPFNKPPPPVPFDKDGRPTIPIEIPGTESHAQKLVEQQQAEAAEAETSHRRPPTTQKQDDQASNEPAKPQPKSYTRMYTSTFSVKEVVHPSGRKSYAAYGSPLRRASIRASRSHGRSFALPHLSQQYLGRIVATQGSQEGVAQQQIAEDRGALDSVGASVAQEGAETQPPAMEAISVKRQRKLKMKKHKYKKLMRRTRNLRKREGRL